MTPGLLALLSPEQREAWGLCQRATPGPWTTREPVKDTDGFPAGVVVAWTCGRKGVYGNPVGGSKPWADCNLIAHARLGYPAALLELAQAKQELADSAAVHYRDITVMADALREAKAELKQRAEEAEKALAALTEDTARLDYIISESNEGNGWLGEDVWDRCDFSDTVDALEPDAEIRRVIDAARGKK